MQFLNKAKLQFEYEEKKVKWYSLKEPLYFSGDNKDFKVPKETFLTDLASVPYGLQWLFKPNGKYTRSAILHDYLYSIRALSRFYCDWIFLKAMKSEGVGLVTRWSFFIAVRSFGWKYR